jgi:hypothetical protein
VHKHTVEVVEASSRVEGATRFVRESVFDFEPLEPIPEEPENTNTGNDNPAVDPSKPKQLRHSYTVKQKYFLLRDYEKAEARLKARLDTGDVLFAVSIWRL